MARHRPTGRRRRAGCERRRWPLRPRCRRPARPAPGRGRSGGGRPRGGRGAAPSRPRRRVGGRGARRGVSAPGLRRRSGGGLGHRRHRGTADGGSGAAGLLGGATSLLGGDERLQLALHLTRRPLETADRRLGAGPIALEPGTGAVGPATDALQLAHRGLAFVAGGPQRIHEVVLVASGDGGVTLSTAVLGAVGVEDDVEGAVVAGTGVGADGEPGQVAPALGDLPLGAVDPPVGGRHLPVDLRQSDAGVVVPLGEDLDSLLHGIELGRDPPGLGLLVGHGVARRGGRSQEGRPHHGCRQRDSEESAAQGRRRHGGGCYRTTPIVTKTRRKRLGRATIDIGEPDERRRAEWAKTGIPATRARRCG